MLFSNEEEEIFLYLPHTYHLSSLHSSPNSRLPPVITWPQELPLGSQCRCANKKVSVSIYIRAPLFSSFGCHSRWLCNAPTLDGYMMQGRHTFKFYLVALSLPLTFIISMRNKILFLLRFFKIFSPDLDFRVDYYTSMCGYLCILSDKVLLGFCL